MGYEVPKHRVQRTILPISTPFLLRGLGYVDPVWGTAGDVPYEYPSTWYMYSVRVRVPYPRVRVPW